MATLGKTILVAVLVATLGMHWALFQSVAWGCMLVKYSTTMPFSEAWSMTFDGQHPCALCKIVAAGKKAEQQQNQPSLKLEVKLDVFLQSINWEFFVPPFAVAFFPAMSPGVSWQESPPVPPPRLA